MFKVDLNSDLGESFGAYKMGMDEEILKFVSSANVACGFHAGDPCVMDETLNLAKQNG
ncbi:LamB/YcsF family protein, partial [Campylobacter coli]